MSDDHNNPVRIVVKKKKGHAGAHGGAWKVAYADFVTAMMALFIVLWIVGQSNPVKKAISGYFKDPGAFSESSRSAGIHPGAAQPLPKPEPVAPNNLQSEVEKLKVESKKIEGIIDSVPAFQKFKDKIQITVTNEGMKIELIEDSKGLFFDIGSAHVKPETVRLLKLIAAEVGKLPNPVIIEGYTDARPYVTPSYSNWELSSDRANAARKNLEENGLRKDQVLEVRGFADRALKQPDKPLDYSNRRVNIIVTIPKKPEKIVPDKIAPAPVASEVKPK
jgi:chemotaxis protein MotB